MFRWKPIEQAPQDGRELVVTDFASPPEFAAWVVDREHYLDGGYWRCRDERHRAVPTHFVDLDEVSR